MSDAARSLTTEGGLARLITILNAQEAWRGMTKAQRAALAHRLHTHVAKRTMLALEERGLVKDGLLTAWGDYVRVVNAPHSDAHAGS